MKKCNSGMKANKKMDKAEVAEMKETKLPKAKKKPVKKKY